MGEGGAEGSGKVRLLRAEADTLAHRLGVSRGSFYLALHGRAGLSRRPAAALARDRPGKHHRGDRRHPDDRLEALLYRAFAGGPSIERAVRAWATADARARAAVEAVDMERIRYLRKLLIDAGIPADAAEARAHIMNWTYLGFALSSSKRDRDALKEIVRTCRNSHA